MLPWKSPQNTARHAKYGDLLEHIIAVFATTALKRKTIIVYG
jgi:hypothetical protein